MLVLALSVFILWYVYHRVKNRRFYDLLAKMPQWKTPLPILGNLLNIIGDGEHVFRLAVTLSKLAEEANSAVVVWFGTQPVICLHKPEDVKIASQSYAGKPFVYDFARPWVQEGLVTASVPVWKRHIKKVAPTFAPTVVDGFVGVFNAQSRLLVSGLQREVGGGPFRLLRDHLTPVTLEIVCQTAFGVTGDGEKIVSQEYLEAFNDVFRLILRRGLNPLLHSDLVYSLTSDSKRFYQCLRILHGFSNSVIKKKREALKMKNCDDTQYTAGYKDFKAFLDLLMELPEDEAFTDEELRSEIDTMIVGGQETTAVVLNFLLLNVGSYPSVQDKLLTELREIVGEERRDLSREDLRRMVYADAVIKETLRLFPPLPGVMRLADREIQLTSGRSVPKGAWVLFNIWGVCRWRRSWGSDADKFHPERWLDPQFAPEPAAYLPFSYGKRVCIGRLYAILVLKTVLAHVLLAYKLKADVSRLRLKLDVGLRAFDGDHIELEPRR